MACLFDCLSYGLIMFNHSLLFFYFFICRCFFRAVFICFSIILFFPFCASFFVLFCVSFLVYFWLWLSMLHVCFFVCLLACWLGCLFVCLFNCPFVCLSVCLFVRLSACIQVCLCVCVRGWVGCVFACVLVSVSGCLRFLVILVLFVPFLFVVSNLFLPCVLSSLVFWFSFIILGWSSYRCGVGILLLLLLLLADVSWEFLLGEWGQYTALTCQLPAKCESVGATCAGRVLLSPHRVSQMMGELFALKNQAPCICECEYIVAWKTNHA